MITTEELQAFVDKEFPDLQLNIGRDRRRLSIFHIYGNVGFVCYSKDKENLNVVKDRLLEALSDAKVLIEHSIAKIEGTE